MEFQRRKLEGGWRTSGPVPSSRNSPPLGTKPVPEPTKLFTCLPSYPAQGLVSCKNQHLAVLIFIVFCVYFTVCLLFNPLFCLFTSVYHIQNQICASTSVYSFVTFIYYLSFALLLFSPNVGRHQFLSIILVLSSFKLKHLKSNVFFS